MIATCTIDTQSSSDIAFLLLADRRCMRVHSPVMQLQMPPTCVQQGNLVPFLGVFVAIPVHTRQCSPHHSLWQAPVNKLQAASTAGGSGSRILQCRRDWDCPKSLWHNAPAECCEAAAAAALLRHRVVHCDWDLQHLAEHLHLDVPVQRYTRTINMECAAPMVCVTDWAATNQHIAMCVGAQWVCNVWVRTRPKTSAAAAAGNTCEAQPDVLSKSSWTLVPQSGYSRLLSIRLLLSPLQLGCGGAPAKGVLCLQLEHGLLELPAALGAAAQCIRDRHPQCIYKPAAKCQ